MKSVPSLNHRKIQWIFSVLNSVLPLRAAEKKKYTANLGASYTSSLKMPLKAHAENEAVTLFAVTIHLESGAFQGTCICQSTGSIEEP